MTYNGVTLEEQGNTKYLGGSVDKKMTWKALTESSAEKAAKKWRLLKQLATTKWGSTQNFLFATYNIYIHPTLEYGSKSNPNAWTSRKTPPCTLLLMHPNQRPLRWCRRNLVLSRYSCHRQILHTILGITEPVISKKMGRISANILSLPDLGHSARHCVLH